jgi:hypothetical protein
LWKEFKKLEVVYTVWNVEAYKQMWDFLAGTTEDWKTWSEVEENNKDTKL